MNNFYENVIFGTDDLVEKCSFIIDSEYSEDELIQIIDDKRFEFCHPSIIKSLSLSITTKYADLFYIIERLEDKMKTHNWEGGYKAYNNIREERENKLKRIIK